MQLFDISLTISPDLPVWPGDPAVKLESEVIVKAGYSAKVTYLNMGAHTGTHVDAPSHFLVDDPRTVEQLDLKVLTGRAYVLHLPEEVEHITGEVLAKAGIPPRTRWLLLRTRNSSLWASPGAQEFQTCYTAVDASGAAFLVDHGIRLVGIDYLSIAPYPDQAPTHELLLQAGVVVLEGLDLSQVGQGRYTLYCLPLKLAGCEGAPARAILLGP